MLCSITAYLLPKTVRIRRRLISYLFIVLISIFMTDALTMVELFLVPILSWSFPNEIIVFMQKSSILLCQSFLIFFIIMRINSKRIDIVIRQLLLDAVIIIVLFGMLAWQYFLSQWSIDLMAIDLFVWICLITDIVILAGLFVWQLLCYHIKTKIHIHKSELITSIGITIFCLIDFLSWTIGYDIGMRLQLFHAFFQQLLFFIILCYTYKFDSYDVLTAQSLEATTLGEQMKRSRYIFFIGILVAALLHFDFVAILFIALLLSLYFFMTRFMFVFDEKVRILAQYEEVNSHLEQLVEQRTKQLVLQNKQLEYISNYDSLTHLANSRYLESYCEQLITNQTAFYFSYLDLDRFKAVNDWFGHDVGDQLLVAVTQRITTLLPKGTFFARQGGDEFIIVWPDDCHIDTYLEQLVASFQQAFTLHTTEILSTFSIGITHVPKQAKTYQEAAKFADIALYRAKSAGKNCWRYYDSGHNQQLILEHDIKLVNFNEQFELYYHPQIDLNSGNVTGCEALIRWNHPTLGIILPANFIPLTEEIGYIYELGDWVIEKAFSQISYWNHKREIPIVMAINLSPKQLRNVNFLPRIHQLISLYGIYPEWIEFELTETVRINQEKDVLAILHELAQLGFSIAIDDFGTGYSSISYLKHLPVHRLKIARELICELDQTEFNTKIVQGIIALAKSIDVQVIAEGVETQEQINLLRNLQCLHAQGYYFSKPMQVHEFTCLINEYIQT